MRSFLVLLASLASPLLVQAQDSILTRLQAAKSLKYEFPIGVLGNWDTKGPNIERGTKGMSLHFDGIDLSAKHARLIGNQGAGDVMAIFNMASINIFETTGLSNVNYTTVFASYQPGTDHFVAVTSRHLSLGIPGPIPIPSQWYGTCRVWE